MKKIVFLILFLPATVGVGQNQNIDSLKVVLRQAKGKAKIKALLDSVAGMHEIEWCWVKGHSGHIENERVDAAANEAIDDMLARRSIAGNQ